MKKWFSLLISGLLILGMLSGCSNEEVIDENFDGVVITLSNDKIKVNGETISTNEEDGVYASNDIIYYEEGHDSTYGEGSKEDEHSEEEASKHTVINITEPGNYKVTGTIDYGQILIDLGEDASTNEEAVVNLVLDNVSITNTVAPAILVLNAYECCSDDAETATSEVDTSKSGFNLIVADNSVNNITGSHVAKIYKEGTTKKLHKYDGTIQSKISFNINGEEKGNGILIVNADNEGIGSNLHLTINGGLISINSNDDSINTNEDGISVLTINGGTVICDAGGGDEGDGIDSNGWIVINGGYVNAAANAKSMDSGLDADNGIILNGGTIFATGNMYDEVSTDSKMNFMVLNFRSSIKENQVVYLEGTDNDLKTAFSSVNDYTVAVYASENLKEGNYELYLVDDIQGDLNGSIYTNITSVNKVSQLQYSSNGNMGFGGNKGGMHGEFNPEDFKDGEIPNMKPDGNMPLDGTTAPSLPDDKMPSGEEGTNRGDFNQGNMPNRDGFFDDNNTELTYEKVFNYSKEKYMFYNITEVKDETTMA